MSKVSCLKTQLTASLKGKHMLFFRTSFDYKFDNGSQEPRLILLGLLKVVFLGLIGSNSQLEYSCALGSLSFLEVVSWLIL